MYVRIYARFLTQLLILKKEWPLSRAICSFFLEAKNDDFFEKRREREGSSVVLPLLPGELPFQCRLTYTCPPSNELRFDTSSVHVYTERRREDEDKILGGTNWHLCGRALLLTDSLENLPESDCDASRTAARHSIIPGRQGPAFKADMSALFFRFLKIERKKKKKRIRKVVPIFKKSKLN